MADVQSNIQVNLDASQALAQLKALQRQLSNFHSSIAATSAQAAKAQAGLQTNLINSINATGKFRASLQEVRSTADSFTDSLERNKFSTREYFRYAGGATKTFGRLFKSEYDTIGKVSEERLKTMQTQYLKMGRTANGAIQSIAIRPLALDMDNLATKTALAAQKQQLFGQLLKQGSTNLLNFGKNTQWAGRQLMVGFTVPLAMLGTTASKTFMELEKQAIRFKRVYGEMFTSSTETDKALKDVQLLAKEFLKYGVAIEKTMEMAADAAASGKMGSDLLAQVSQATRLAVLGNIEQNQALETTISLTNAFGIAADELKGKIDFLNAVENQTVLNIEDLTIAIPKAAPVIRQLGGDVEDLAFFMTAMKEGGINASEGANALKSGLASLINPSKKAAGFLADLGININGIVEGNKGNIKNTVVQFAQALDTLDPLNRARAIEQLFGKFQFSRLSTLFQNITKDGTQASRTLNLAGASVEELAILSERELAKVENATGTKFKKSLESLKLALAPVGEQFLKAITPIVEFFGRILEKFNGLGEGSKKAIVMLVGAVGLIGPALLMTFGLIANGAANIIKLFLTLRNGFLGLGGQSKILGNQTQYMSTQQLEAAAIASSLDQTHSRLIQTFTSEVAATNALAAAYQRATAAGANFARTNPGMMRPGFKGGAPRKYADGIVSVPGPKGAGDIVPAMLSPGESVIPAPMSEKYGSLIQGIVADNIPGFEQGRTPKGTHFAHVDSFKKVTVKDLLAEIEKGSPEFQADRAGLVQKLKGIQNTFGPNHTVNIVNSHGFTQSPKLNFDMIGNEPVKLADFLEDFEKHGPEKWRGSLKNANASGQFPTGDPALADFDERITNRLKALLPPPPPAPQPAVAPEITSSDFAKIEAEEREKIKSTSLKNAFAKSRNKIKDVRVNIGAEEAQSKGVLVKKDRIKKSTGKVTSVNYVSIPLPNGSTWTVQTGSGRVAISGEDMYDRVPNAANAQQVPIAKPGYTANPSANKNPWLAGEVKKDPNMPPAVPGSWAPTEYLKKKREKEQAQAKVKKLFIGMPDTFSDVQSVRTQQLLLDAIDEEVQSSKLAKTTPTKYGKLIAESSGRSFPVPGIGGIYEKPGGSQVFVKPAIDLKSAMAEERSTRIQRDVHGLDSPKQTIGTMVDPTNPDRRLIVLESPVDSKFQDMPGTFTKEQFFRQAVASFLRGDKDLTKSNLSGNVVADVGAAGVFGSASGKRDFAQMLSLKNQAMINLLDPSTIGSRARSDFALSTASIARSMTADEYHTLMKAEIERIVPKLKATISSFGLLDPQERIAYDSMIKRLEEARSVDWRELHKTHIAVQPKVVPKKTEAAIRKEEEKASLKKRQKGHKASLRDRAFPKPITPRVRPVKVGKFADGIVSVPGPKGAGDVVPAMLSPGESVIPADMTQKYGALINGMISDNIPGHEDGKTGTPPGPGYTWRPLDSDGWEGTGHWESESDKKQRIKQEKIQAAKEKTKNAAQKARTVAASAVEKGKTAVANRYTPVAAPAPVVASAPSGLLGPDGKPIQSSPISGTPDTPDANAQPTAKQMATERRRASAQRISGGLMGGTMAAGMLAMAPGKAGEIGQTLAPIMGVASMVAPMLGTKTGAFAIPVMAFLGAMVKLRMEFDKAQNAAMDLTEATGTSTKAIQSYAEFSGKATSTQIMDRKRQTARGGLVAVTGKTTFGENYVNSASGIAQAKAFQQKLIDPKNTRGSVAEDLKAQLSTSILSGALTSEQARSIAANIGQAMGDTMMGIKVAGELQGIFGQNGENILDTGIEIRTKLMQDSTKTSTALFNNAKAKGSGGFGGFNGLGMGAKIGLGAAGGALIGAKAGSMAGSAIGSIIPGAGTALGAGIGTAAGAAIGGLAGGFIAYKTQVKYNKQLAEISGAAVVQNQNMLEQSKQLIDSYELQYKQKREQLIIEGKISEVKQLDDKYDKNRAILDAERLKQRESVLKSYESTKGNTRNSVNTAIDKAVTKKYKGTTEEGFVGASKDMLGEAIKTGNLKDTQVAGLKLQLSAGEIAPSEIIKLFNTFSKKEDLQQTVAIMTKLGGEDGAAALDIVQAFQDSNGKPIESLQSDFMLQLGTKKGKDADEFLTMMQKFSRLGGVLELDLETETLLKNPEAQKELSKDLKAIEDNKGVFTTKILSEIEPKFIGTVDPEYLKKLTSPEQRNTYLSTIRTLLTYDNEILMKDKNFLQWQKETGKYGGAQYSKLSLPAQLAKYREAIGQKVTETTSDTSFGGGTGPTTPAVKKERDTTFDDMAKKLKLVQQASIDALGGMNALRKAMNNPIKKGGGFNAFNGIANQLLKSKKVGTEFVDYIKGLSPEDIQKNFSKFGLSIKDGILKIGKDAAVLNKVLSAIFTGDLVADNAKRMQELADKTKAVNILRQKGVSYEVAMEIAANNSTNKQIINGKLKGKALDEIIASQTAVNKAEEKYDRVTTIAQQDALVRQSMKNEALMAYAALQEKLVENEYILQKSAATNKLADNAYALELITRQEDKINERYDAQIAALEEINKLQEQSNELQSKKMDIASALASGDMAAAASAMQEYRNAQIAKNAKTRMEATQKAKENAIKGVTSPAGQTRKQLEDSSKILNEELVDVDEKIRLRFIKIDENLKKIGGYTKAQAVGVAEANRLAIAAGFKADDEQLALLISQSAEGITTATTAASLKVDKAMVQFNKDLTAAVQKTGQNFMDPAYLKAQTDALIANAAAMDTWASAFGRYLAGIGKDPGSRPTPKGTTLPTKTTNTPNGPTGGPTGGSTGGPTGGSTGGPTGGSGKASVSVSGSNINISVSSPAKEITTAMDVANAKDEARQRNFQQILETHEQTKTNITVAMADHQTKVTNENKMKAAEALAAVKAAEAHAKTNADAGERVSLKVAEMNGIYAHSMQAILLMNAKQSEATKKLENIDPAINKDPLVFDYVSLLGQEKQKESTAKGIADEITATKQSDAIKKLERIDPAINKNPLVFDYVSMLAGVKNNEAKAQAAADAVTADKQKAALTKVTKMDIPAPAFDIAGAMGRGKQADVKAAADAAAAQKAAQAAAAAKAGKTQTAVDAQSLRGIEANAAAAAAKQAAAIKAAQAPYQKALAHLNINSPLVLAAANAERDYKIKYGNMGGMVPKYMASGGFARGTDTVPAMLTPGEFIVNRKATQRFGPLLSAINSPTFKSPDSMSSSIRNSNGSKTAVNNSKTLYNYNLSVNVSNSGANPNDIARSVINQIKQVDNQRIRSF